ncbi:hypothetical protein BH11PLA1_BH11PLA1_11510 [soil metagenome]
MNTNPRSILSLSSPVGRPLRGALRRAFTLLEMLVVIVIITILILIAVPAFSSIIASQEESTADAVLGAGVGLARNAARQTGGAGGNSDTAAVFAYEPNGKTTIIVCQKVGVYTDDQDSNRRTVAREVFAPIDGYEVLQLPKGWMVRGMALASMVDGDWYEKGPNSGNARYPADISDWVFPETGFYDHSKQEDEGARQTFMVRFEAGSGRALPPGGDPVLVILERASLSERDAIASGEDQMWKRLDRADSPRRWALRVLSDPSLNADERRRLIGDASGDTVLAKSVNQLALYPERKLAEALGLRLNEYTGSLYFADANQYRGGGTYRLQYVPGLEGGDFRSGVHLALRRWLEGWNPGTSGNFQVGTAQQDRAQSQSAKLYVVPPYTGALTPLTLPSASTLEQPGALP